MLRLVTAAIGPKRGDHILIADGRFRGEADMHSGVASTNLVELTPLRHWLPNLL
jgi:hypothetical protein